MPNNPGSAKFNSAETTAPRPGLKAAFGSVDTYVIAALFLLLLVHAQRGWMTTKDDAFITFRYAEHLAHGQGLVWNPGDGPVEGYTNFLFMIIMAVFALFKADLVFASKLVNLVSAAAVFFMLIEIFNRVYRDRFLVYFGLFLFAFPYFISAHIAGGLETMFYAMLVTLCGLMLLRQMELYSGKRQTLMCLAMLSLGLTRPEGVLVAGLLVILELMLVKESRSIDYMRRLALWLVLPGAAYMIARVLYFHYWLPNPFYIKKSDKLFSLVGLIELQEFILKSKIFVGIIFVPFIAEKSRKALLVLTAIFLPSLAVYMFFRPMMNYAFRYYMPYYPLMLPVLGAPLFFVKKGLDHILGRRKKLAAVRYSYTVTLVLIAVVLLCPYITSNYFNFKYWRQQGKKLNDCHIYIGKIFGRFPEFRNRYIAIGDAGAISYYSKWKVIDLGGLNDVHLAHYGRATASEMDVFATKMDFDYVFSKDPAVLMLASSNPITVDHHAARALAENPRIKNYERAFAIEYSPLIFEILYFKKNDRALQKLRTAFEEASIMRGTRRIRDPD